MTGSLGTSCVSRKTTSVIPIARKTSAIALRATKRPKVAEGTRRRRPALRGRLPAASLIRRICVSGLAPRRALFCTAGSYCVRQRRRKRRPLPEEATSMPCASRDELPLQEVAPGYSSRFADWGGMTVGLEAAPAGMDASSMLASLPDGRCQARHWGYLITGRIVVDYGDRRGGRHGRPGVLRRAGASDLVRGGQRSRRVHADRRARADACCGAGGSRGAGRRARPTDSRSCDEVPTRKEAPMTLVETVPAEETSADGMRLAPARDAEGR